MSNTTLIDRAVIRLSGEGVRAFLQGLVTNDVLGALPVWAALLTPQGKALFDFLIWSDTLSDALLIDCEAAEVDALVRRLTIYRLRLPIVIARETALAVHWSRETGHGVPDPRNHLLGMRWLAPPTTPTDEWLAHRLACGVVEGVAELGSDQRLWLECNAIAQHGVSFTKGCYIGQENTARMFHRDKVRKQLRVVSAHTAPDGALAWYPDLNRAVVSDRLTSET